MDSAKEGRERGITSPAVARAANKGAAVEAWIECRRGASRRSCFVEEWMKFFLLSVFSFWSNRRKDCFHGGRRAFVFGPRFWPVWGLEGCSTGNLLEPKERLDSDDSGRREAGHWEMAPRSLWSGQVGSEGEFSAGHGFTRQGLFCGRSEVRLPPGSRSVDDGIRGERGGESGGGIVLESQKCE